MIERAETSTGWVELARVVGSRSFGHRWSRWGMRHGNPPISVESPRLPDVLTRARPKVYFPEDTRSPPQRMRSGSQSVGTIGGTVVPTSFSGLSVLARGLDFHVPVMGTWHAMEQITIWQADFRDTLKRVADAGGCDLIFTSPPYCDARTAGAYGTEREWTEADYRDLGDLVKAALKPGGWAIVNVDAPVREWRKGYGTERGFHAWRLMLDWAERVGLRVPDRLAFGRMGIVGAYKGRFRNDWEPLLWFQRIGAPGYFDKSAVDERAVYGSNKSTCTGFSPDGSVRSRRRSGDAVERGIKRRGTVWAYGATGSGQSGSRVLEQTGHPARFPLRLARDVVACFSAPGALVCDPFLGSGTTAVACAQLGRAFVGGDAGRASDGRSWADVAIECVSRDGQVARIGRADPTISPGVVCASFNAG